MSHHPKRDAPVLRAGEMYVLTLTITKHGEVLICAQDERDHVLVDVTDQIRLLVREKR